MWTNIGHSHSASLSHLESLFQDTRFAFRFLSRRSGFSFVVILVLALGIGANTAMFSIVNAVLLRPLPYRDSDRLVLVWQSSSQHRETGEWFNTYSEFQQWHSKSRSFEKLAALSWASGPKSLVWKGKKRKILAIPVSIDFFPMLGVAAERGRTFESQDLNAGCTTVLSHTFWQNELGAPADLTGKGINISGQSCLVAGIMPKGFSFYPTQTALWMLITPESEYEKDPWRSVTGVFGRLRPGVTRQATQSELETLEANILPQAPAGLGLPYDAVPVVLDLQAEFTWLAGRNLRSALIMLLGTVFAVLLIACVNVAGLLLARVADRQRELAIRASLGCGRARLVRQALIESLILSLAGAFIGVLIAAGAIQIFRAKNPIELPPGSPIEVNWQVLMFTVALAIVVAVLFGLVPAWRASRVNVSGALKEAGQSVASSRGAHRTRSLMVVAEVGMSLVLLAGAGLLLQSLARLASAPLGFRTDHLLTASLDLPDKKYAEPEQKIQFSRRMVQQLSSIPGVAAASLSSSFFLLGSNELAVEGREFSRTTAAHNVAEQTVDPDFLQVMDIPLLQGREFDSRDQRNTQQVAIVNQALAGQYFANENPIGRQIKLGTPESSNPWLTIIGVAGDVKTTTVFQEMGYVVKAAVYRPLAQQPLSSVALFLRTHEEPNAIAKPLQQKLLALDDELTLSDVKSMDERLSDLQAEPRFRTVLLSAFAGLGLLLAALGIYGLMMQSVIRRTREIGIRMALGATRADVSRAVLRQAVSTVAGGIVLGLAASVFLARLIAGLLYDVRWNNPLVFALVSFILVLVAVLASYFPARRATAVDPLQALRDQ